MRRAFREGSFNEDPRRYVKKGFEYGHLSPYVIFTSEGDLESRRGFVYRRFGMINEGVFYYMNGTSVSEGSAWGEGS